MAAERGLDSVHVDSKYCHDYSLCMWNAHRTLDTDLSGLVIAVAAVLSTLNVDVGDDRIREVPTARVLRYYQSSGLIDRPLRYDGRRAMYGFRHLVQAVAVKVLQGEGWSLARIQEALAGRATDELAGLLARTTTLPSALGSAAQRAPARSAVAEPSPQVRSVLQVELAAGVTVTIDPSVVSDPKSLLVAMSAAIATRGA